MNRTALLSLAALFSLSACGGGSSGSATPATAPLVQTASAPILTPYRMPTATSPAAQAAARQLKAHRRAPKTSIGGVPTIGTRVRLTDGPKWGPGAEVDLAVVGVQAVSQGTAYPIEMFDEPVVINVLDLQHSVLELADGDIPAIPYEGLRLVVDPALSSVVALGKRYPVLFGSFDTVAHRFNPSGDAIASVNFAMPFDASAGSEVSLLIDFDIMESISIRGGVARIGPKVHGSDENSSAVIVGALMNAAGTPVEGATVLAVGPDGSVAATATSAGDGSFELHALAAGTYQLTIANSYVSASGDQQTASGADSTDTIAGPRLSVPAGFKIDMGRIRD